MPDYQVSDATISKNFLVACDSLCGWVGGFPDIKSFTEALYDAVHHRGIDENILIFPREFQLELDHAQSEVLTMIYLQDYWRTYTRTSSSRRTASGSRTPRTYLWHDVDAGTRKKVGVPSTTEYRRLLISVDTKSIDLWRSDTVRACTATQVYNDKIIQCCFGLAEYLRGLFSYFSCEETVDLDQKLGRLEQQILPQIAVLALRMKCSPEQYWWDGDRDFDWTQPIIVYKSYLSQFINQGCAYPPHALTLKLRDLRTCRMMCLLGWPFWVYIRPCFARSLERKMMF